jgi:cytochrome c nitrite reductase small subunit
VDERRDSDDAKAEPTEPQEGKPKQPSALRRFLTEKSEKGSRWPLLSLGFAVALGALGGVGSYTFRYAEGFSYFKTDPRACANCHIMQPQFDSWQKASHHAVAVCVDCHLPHEFVPKYIAKAENGWRHGKLFTTGGFKEPIEVQEFGKRILQANCENCHQEMVSEMNRVDGVDSSHPVVDYVSGDHPLEKQILCTHCHSTVGHGVRAAVGGPMTHTENER